MPEQGEVELATIGPSGKPPKTRLQSARMAVQKFHLWREASLPRLSRAAVIRGMYDGNPPFLTAKRRRAGNEWQANFNTLEGGARLESAKVPFYDLSSSTQTYFETSTKVNNPEGLDAAEASGAIAEECDETLKAWAGYETHLWMMLDDFIAFNRGFLFWPRDDSWHFARIPWHRVKFPEAYGLDTDEWEEFAIEHSYSVERMWSFIRDEDTAGARGWNVPEVVKAIRRAVPNWQEDDAMAVQKRLKEHMVQPSAMASTVQCASVFFKEFDGTWSRMIVPSFQEDAERDSVDRTESMVERRQRKGSDDETALSKGVKSMGDKSWLCYKKNVGDELQQILAAFIFETHDGSINALEGQGKKIVALMQWKNRNACSVADNSMLRQNVVLQPQNPSSMIKAGLIQVSGGVTVIPAGFNVQNEQIWGDVETGLAVNNHFDRVVDTNTGVYRPQFEKPEGNPESATAASLRFNQGTMLSQSAVNRFYTQYDRFGQELFRRMTLPKSELTDETNAGVVSALDFQRRCSERGVSRAQLMDVVKRKSVRAVRSIGNGSSAMRQQMLSSLFPIIQHMKQRGLVNFLHDWVAAFAGHAKVRRYFPTEDEQNIPSFHDWAAEQENADMQQGAPALISDDQNHEVHAVRHLMKGFEAIQAVQQGADPTSAYLFLQTAIPHIEQHAQLIAREEQRKQVEQGLKQLEQGFRQIQQLVKQQRQQAQQHSQMDGEMQMKVQEHQLKMEERMAKMEERNVKAEQAMQSKEEKHQQQIRHSEEQMLNEERRLDEQSQADIERKARESRQKESAAKK